MKLTGPAIIHYAKGSYGHRHEPELLKWLANILTDLDTDILVEAGIENWTAEDWRKGLAEADPKIPASQIDILEEITRDNITDLAEVIASRGYDYEGPAHSGWNGVYEFYGVYSMGGSDFIKGPSDDYVEFLELFNFEEAAAFECTSLDSTSFRSGSFAQSAALVEVYYQS